MSDDREDERPGEGSDDIPGAPAPRGGQRAADRAELMWRFAHQDTTGQGAIDEIADALDEG